MKMNRKGAKNAKVLKGCLFASLCVLGAFVVKNVICGIPSSALLSEIRYPKYSLLIFLLS